MDLSSNPPDGSQQVKLKFSDVFKDGKLVMPTRDVDPKAHSLSPLDDMVMYSEPGVTLPYAPVLVLGSSLASNMLPRLHPWHSMLMPGQLSSKWHRAEVHASAKHWCHVCQG